MDQFVVVLQVLTNKLVEAEERIEGMQKYQSQGWDSSAQVEKELEEKCAKIADLEADVRYWRNLYDKQAEHNHELRQQLSTRLDDVHRLQSIIAATGTIVPNTQEDKEKFARSCLDKMGVDMVRDNKITAIKSYKSATNWGLRECKDFLEDWLKPSVFERADG